MDFSRRNQIVHYKKCNGEKVGHESAIYACLLIPIVPFFSFIAAIVLCSIEQFRLMISGLVSVLCYLISAHYIAVNRLN